MGNSISEDEKNKINEEIDIELEATQLIVGVIGEVYRKTLYEGEQNGRKEGRNNAMGEMAVKLKDVLSVEKIGEQTGLTIERVKELI